MFYFGAMFFKVQAWIFVQLIVFQAPTSISVPSCLSKKRISTYVDPFP